MEAALPCQLRTTKRSAKYREIEGGSNKIQKSKHACIVETHESMRKRLEGTIKRSRRSHCGDGVQLVESLWSCGQVCSYAPSNWKFRMQQEQSVDKEWAKPEKLPVWQMTKIKSKTVVILEAQKEQRTFHFAALMDICHLKNCRSGTKASKDKGGVVVQGDIARERFRLITEQGSSASQMSNGCNRQGYQIVPDKQPTQYQLARQ